VAQVIVRNLDDQVVDRLKERAKRKGRSLETELRFILAEAAQPSRADLRAEMGRIRAMSPRRLKNDSTDLIREDRDRR
jgi:plasmid stability protein